MIVYWQDSKYRSLMDLLICSSNPRSFDGLPIRKMWQPQGNRTCTEHTTCGRGDTTLTLIANRVMHRVSNLEGKACIVLSSDSKIIVPVEVNLWKVIEA